MYLISIYFDEKTNKIIQNHINRVAEKTGNRFMTDGQVPPHITISAFETKNEEQVIEVLKQKICEMERGQLQWVSTGQFPPYVIYLTPVLSKYLNSMCQSIYDGIREIEDIKISSCYQPFQWLPHTTIGKKLSKKEMQTAFEVLQKDFTPFDGSVVRIGLAKTNPYKEVFTMDI